MKPVPTPIHARLELGERIFEKRTELQDWFASKSKASPSPFYCSIDIRDAGFKIAPVDCNLYPAGFNNICAKDMAVAPTIIRNWVNRFADRQGLPSFGKCILIPEKNTRNLFYNENLLTLQRLLLESKIDTQIGWPEESEGAELESISGVKFHAHPLENKNGKLSIGNFVPDFILLNNDFSSGYPTFLDEVTQPILPSKKLGWHTRKKSTHFDHYNRLAKAFAQIISVDPWMLTVDSEAVSPVNFNEDQGMDLVASRVDQMIAKLREQYTQRQVEETPTLFIKSNQGTYGMGIMQATSGEELLQLNRREKNKMSVGKNKSSIDSVIVQEGIPTSLTSEGKVAEPVIYLVGCELLGGFLRTHEDRGKLDNLNSKGMLLKRLCTSDLQQLMLADAPSSSETPYRKHLFELVYGSIARLSALAAGMEIAESGL